MSTADAATSGLSRLAAMQEREIVRDRWRRALRSHALDRPDRDDFGRGGLGARLREPTAQLLVLTADPGRDVVTIDDGFRSWLEQQKVLLLDGRPFRLGESMQSTAHAVALIEGYERTDWRGYFAVYRSGAIEVGLGDRGGWARIDRDETTRRQFHLVSAVAHVFAALKLLREVQDRTPLPAPFQLTVALRDTKDAALGNLAEGWAEPNDLQNHTGGCVDPHLLWHIELDEMPDERAAQAVAIDVGDRLEMAWGSTNARHIAYRGDIQGRLDLRSVTNR